MSKMHISETVRFAVRYILPVTLVVIIIFLTMIFAFPTFDLTSEEFTLIYWSFGVVSFLLNHQAKRWTEYVVKNHGAQMEKNPVMKKMFIKGDLKQYWISWLGIYLLLFFFYIIGVNVQVYLPFLIFPSQLLAITLYDFSNDFYWLRRLENKPKNQT